MHDLALVTAPAQRSPPVTPWVLVVAVLLVAVLRVVLLQLKIGGACKYSRRLSEPAPRGDEGQRDRFKRGGPYRCDGGD